MNPRIRKNIGSIICVMLLIVGIGLMAWPSINDTIRLHRILSEKTPIGYVMYENKAIPVVEDYIGNRAPEGPVAGLWLDDNIVPSANYTYIIGHNPGIFSFVLNLNEGEKIILSGAVGEYINAQPDDERRTYIVSESFDVEKGTYITDVERHLSDEQQEALILQACTDNSEKKYHIVICLPEEVETETSSEDSASDVEE